MTKFILPRREIIRPTRRSLLTGLAVGLVAAPAIARAGSLTLLGAGKPSGGSAAPTLNPSDKGAGITLTNGDLTATRSATPRNAVRSTTSKSSGKFYFEIAFSSTGASGGFDHCVGIANASANLVNSPAPGGNDNNSIAKYLGSANVQLNNSTVGSSNTASPPSTVCVAVDFSGSVIWFRIGSGNWNNNAANDPATGTGGISFSTINAGPFFVIVALEPSGTTAVGTINFGASAYSFTPPSGFGNW